ncbi:MAG: guanylate kinase [Clostridia bacterium]|nr:guanylate kinase [Clostridia bacterium]
MTDKKGLLIVVSGPSGVGKGTVLGKVFEKRDDMYYSVSATTREMREGEKDGVNYHFLSEEEFLKIKAEDGFLESACYCDNYYGTLKEEVFKRIDKGINVVLEIEVQGAMQIRRKHPEGVFIYILPPSYKALRERLLGRGTDDLDKIEKRLEAAKWELTQIDKYNYLVVNDIVEEAADELNSIIEAEHLRTPRVYDAIQEMLANDEI